MKTIKKGFTTIDLMISVAIIVAISLFAVPNYVENSKNVEQMRIESDISSIENAIDMYFIENNQCPVEGNVSQIEINGENINTITISEDISEYMQDLENDLEDYVMASGGTIIKEEKLHDNNSIIEIKENKKENKCANELEENKDNSSSSENIPDKKNPQLITPDSPSINNLDINSVTIVGEEKTEVKLGPNGKWKESPHTFSNLKENEYYVAYSRFKGDKDNFASKVSKGTPFKTLKKEENHLTLKDIPVGSVIYDPSWKWEFKKGNSYTGGGETNYLSWKIVAKNHEGYPENSVTLISNKTIGKVPYDNSIRSNQGSNHWGESGTTSATMGVRTWLHEVFYESFSQPFKENVLLTQTPNYDKNDGYYKSNDKVFIPSFQELGLYHDKTNSIGLTYEYFANNGLKNNNESYWTRSAIKNPSFKVGIILQGNAEDINANKDYIGVRPVVNLDENTVIIEKENGTFEISYEN